MGNYGIVFLPVNFDGMFGSRHRGQFFIPKVVRALDLVAIGIFGKEIRRNLDPLKRVSVDEGFRGLPGVMRCIEGNISKEGLFLSMRLGLGEKAEGFIGNDFTPV